MTFGLVPPSAPLADSSSLTLRKADGLLRELVVTIAGYDNHGIWERPQGAGKREGITGSIGLVQRLCHEFVLHRDDGPHCVDLAMCVLASMASVVNLAI